MRCLIFTRGLRFGKTWRRSTTIRIDFSALSLLIFVHGIATGGKCGDATNSTNVTCVCAGKWRDTNYIDCDVPTTPTSGSAKLTATNGTYSASINVFIHPRIARVVVGTSTPVSCSAPPTAVPDCTSSAGTFQIYAQACDAANNPAVVDNGDGSGFTYPVSDPTVVVSDNKGLLTAANPGIANVFANTSNVTSSPISFTTCAVKSISAHVTGVTDTSFTADAANSKTLVADVVDTKNKAITITNSRINWSTSNLGVATVDSAGVVTTVSPGVSGIVASCTPPTCNKGFNPIYSNVVVAKVNGTSATDIVVASPSSTSLYPITSSTGVVGTAVTLPYAPNSLVYARTGLGAYLGSDTTLMAYDARGTAGAITTANGNVPGIVVGVSYSAGLIGVYDPAKNTVSIVNYTGTGASLVDTITVSGIPASCQTTNQCPKVAFTPDDKTAYIAAGSNLYVSSQNASLKTIPLGVAAKDLTVSKQGSFVFISQNDFSIAALATCNNSKIGAGTVSTPSVPQLIEGTEDATKLYALTPPTLGIVTTTTDAVGCPPSLTDPLSSVDLGQGTFTPRQLLVSSNGQRVVTLTNGTKVIIYDSADTTTPVKPVTLSGGATVLSGGITLDGAFAYVGGSDKTIHKIDLATGAESGTPITVTITPDLVGVKPKQD